MSSGEGIPFASARAVTSFGSSKGVLYWMTKLGVILGCASPRWHVKHVTRREPPKLFLLSVLTIAIMCRAVVLRGVSFAKLAQSSTASSPWQSVQFQLRDAEKKPMVSMNSSTEIPLSTVTSLNATSAICAPGPPGFTAPAGLFAAGALVCGFVAGAVCPAAKMTLNMHVAARAAEKPKILPLPAEPMKPPSVLRGWFRDGCFRPVLYPGAWFS